MLSQEPYDKYTLKQFTRLGSPENQVVLSSRQGSKGLEFILGMEKDNFLCYNSTKREIEKRLKKYNFQILSLVSKVIHINLDS